MDWNITGRESHLDKTLQALFEEQVDRTPNNLSISYEERRFNYKELNVRSNQLAHYLMKLYEIKPDTLIALYLDKTEHLLVGILGILKAGGAYVPIDPGYPDNRIEHILNDTSTKLVITNKIYSKSLENLIQKKNLKVINLRKNTKMLKLKNVEQGILILSIDDDEIQRDFSKAD